MSGYENGSGAEGRATPMTSPEVRPIARTENLLSTELASGEVVVFDKERNRAHCLNPAAAVVWRGCDGRRTASELAAFVAEATGTAPDETVVWASVMELRKLRLLKGIPDAVVPGVGLTRREALVRAGARAAAAAALVPLVHTVLAPKSAAAASCLQSGAACTAGAECCSGSCVGNVCA